MARYIISVMDKRLIGKFREPRTYSVELEVSPQVGWKIAHANGEIWKVESIEINLANGVITIFCEVES